MQLKKYYQLLENFRLISLCALLPGLRKMLTGLQAWHSDRSFAESNVGLETKLEAFREPMLHPSIIKHPDTSIPCVYVNGDFTTHFEGWSEKKYTFIVVSL